MPFRHDRRSKHSRVIIHAPRDVLWNLTVVLLLCDVHLQACRDRYVVTLIKCLQLMRWWMQSVGRAACGDPLEGAEPLPKEI